MSVIYLLVINLGFMANNDAVFKIRVDRPESDTQQKIEQVTEEKKQSEVYFFGINLDKPMESIKPSFDKGIERMEADNGRQFKKLLSSVMGKALFVLLPIFAFLLYLMYWRHKERTYIQFIYFSLHFHAALFGALLISHFFESILGSYAMLLWFIWSGVYLFLAMRRVWGGSFKAGLLRSLAVLSIYGIIFVITFSALVTYSAYKLGQ